MLQYETILNIEEQKQGRRADLDEIRKEKRV